MTVVCPQMALMRAGQASPHLAWSRERKREGERERERRGVVKAGMSAAEEEEEERWPGKRTFWRDYCDEIRAFSEHMQRRKGTHWKEGFAKGATHLGNRSWRKANL